MLRIHCKSIASLLQVCCKPIVSPSQTHCKPTGNPLQAPCKPIANRLQAYFKPITTSLAQTRPQPVASPLQAPSKLGLLSAPHPTPLQQPPKPAARQPLSPVKFSFIKSLPLEKRGLHTSQKRKLPSLLAAARSPRAAPRRGRSPALPTQPAQQNPPTGLAGPLGLVRAH